MRAIDEERRRDVHNTSAPISIGERPLPRRGRRGGAAGSSIVPVERGAELPLTSVDREVLVGMYRDMSLIRRLEEKAAEMYTGAKIGGYIHLNIGEEATIVGALGVLEPVDYVFSNYREHGHALLRGVTPRAIMAELFGKETGCSRGRGGSMHLFDLGRRFMGGYAVVGGSLPLAVGVGLAIDYRRGDEIVMAVFGEGSTNIGAFHESLNLAKLWSLPIVFLCVNNQYAMGDRPEEDSAVPEVYRKACAYGMVAERVDGMDVLAVRAAAERLMHITREERVPVLLEAVCYRIRGHSMADPARYRGADELARWQARDPLAEFPRQLEQAGLLSPEEVRRIDDEIDEQVDDAVEFAEASPSPDEADLFDYVYAESPEHSPAGLPAGR